MWPAIELVPSLQRLVENEALNAAKLSVPMTWLPDETEVNQTDDDLEPQ